MPSICLKTVTLDQNVFLAPMAGVTDFPLRSLVRQFGVGLCYTEMIADKAMIRASEKTLRMSSCDFDEGNTAVQLVGGDPLAMAEAAKMNEQRGAAIIDINMGCPVKKVVKGVAGAALMKEESLAGKIIAAVTKAVSVPVTVKMRLGWDTDHINAPRIAYIAQENGAQMATVHGRTRQQFFSGNADYQKINDVVKTVSIPVIANGDITTVEDAKKAMEISGAQGIMIGRAIYGRPWFPSHVIAYLNNHEKYPSPSLWKRSQILLDHFQRIIDYYGQERGVRIARKHIGWYSREVRGGAQFRAKINSAKNTKEVRTLIASFFEQAYALTHCENTKIEAQRGVGMT